MSIHPILQQALIRGGLTPKFVHDLDVALDDGTAHASDEDVRGAAQRLGHGLSKLYGWRTKCRVAPCRTGGYVVLDPNNNWLSIETKEGWIPPTPAADTTTWGNFATEADAYDALTFAPPYPGAELPPDDGTGLGLPESDQSRRTAQATVEKMPDLESPKRITRRYTHLYKGLSLNSAMPDIDIRGAVPGDVEVRVDWSGIPLRFMAEVRMERRIVGDEMHGPRVPTWTGDIYQTIEQAQDNLRQLQEMFADGSCTAEIELAIRKAS